MRGHGRRRRRPSCCHRRRKQLISRCPDAIAVANHLWFAACARGRCSAPNTRDAGKLRDIDGAVNSCPEFPLLFLLPYFYRGCSPAMMKRSPFFFLLGWFRDGATLAHRVCSSATREASRRTWSAQNGSGPSDIRRPSSAMLAAVSYSTGIKWL